MLLKRAAALPMDLDLAMNELAMEMGMEMAVATINCYSRLLIVP